MVNVSIIILTFNSVHFIKPCLGSVFTQNHHDFEVIIIDNGSTDGTVRFIKETYPQIRLIENKENLGACKARNQGIRVAQGKWVLTLDCDMVLEKDFLERMKGFAEQAGDNVGAFQPKILQMDKKTIYSCGICLSKLKRGYDIGKGQANNGRFDQTRYIFGACSAAALYKRQMLEAIKEDTGYFDERFFFLLEDVDFSWRAGKNGWRTKFCPQVICYHHGNSSNLGKEYRQYLCWRNRQLFLKKSKLNMAKLFLCSLIYDAPRLFFLILANSRVRREIKNRGIGYPLMS